MSDSSESSRREPCLQGVVTPTAWTARASSPLVRVDPPPRQIVGVRCGIRTPLLHPLHPARPAGLPVAAPASPCLPRVQMPVNPAGHRLAKSSPRRPAPRAAPLRHLFLEPPQQADLRIQPRRRQALPPPPQLRPDRFGSPPPRQVQGAASASIRQGTGPRRPPPPGSVSPMPPTSASTSSTHAGAPPLAKSTVAGLRLLCFEQRRTSAAAAPCFSALRTSSGARLDSLRFDRAGPPFLFQQGRPTSPDLGFGPCVASSGWFR
ncbi:proline-rich receptor-like protein kinase PERK9 isoform X2 [Triticum urartu]|uniref:proline-rich receptor-like protein kinase PERK9 isoform X2 n=1 Tax=Triticum urartu TaxID=4572 RepID=UPI002042CD42|nr:proline-rich receptor-like protein kinase PERK9 isoform X2 [Triticum urartu]